MEDSDDCVTGLTFATIYNRIADLISINAGVLIIAQWAQAAAEPHFLTWLSRTAQVLPKRFPGFPKETPDSGALLKQIASEYHRSAVSVQYLFTISRCGPEAFGIDLDVELLGAADRTRHSIVNGGNFTEAIERLHGMLDATLFATQAAVFAVAQSCGYDSVIDHTGIIFTSTSRPA